MRKLAVLLVTLIVAAAAAGGVFYAKLSSWATTPFGTDQEKIVTIARGTSLALASEQLAQSGAVSDALFFRLMVRLDGSFPRFQAGTYKFSGSTSPQNIAQTIIQGKIFEPIIVEFTIPEGFNIKQIARRLEANRIGTYADTMKLMTDRSFIDKVVKQPVKSLEGFLYPAKYSFVKIPSAKETLAHMVETFYNKMPKDLEAKMSGVGLSLGQIVTFASLIEMETKHDDERTKVAEVIWARLKDKAPLAIDAALIYGIKDYAGDIKRIHLEDAKNPYNTRIHRGLPPTPIGSVSVQSVEAIFKPTDFGYYYYVLKPGTDRHHFSKTLKEHNQHVQKLIRASRRQSRK